MSIIKGKIDVTKISKEDLFKGEKGTYLDIAIFVNDADDQYGNRGMIVQDISKEKREAGERGAILGNIKIFEKRINQSNSEPADDNFEGEQVGDDDSIPF